MTCELTVLALLPWENDRPVLLSNPGGGFILTGWTGLGIPEVRRLSVRGAQQQGFTDRGYRQDGRRIALEWILIGGGKRPLWDVADLRRYLYSIFRPRESAPIPLRFISIDGRVRQTDVNLVGVLDAPSNDQAGYAAQRVTAVFESGEIPLYEPVQRSTTFAVLVSEGASGGWEVPWDVPWQIGQSELARVQAVAYANNDPLADVEYPVIRVTGPIENPIISNLTTDEHLKFSGLLIPAGTYVDVDLRYGQKTAVDNNGNAVDGYLTSDSDLASWHLAYRGELLANGAYSDGSNQVQVTGLNATLNSSVTIYYYHRFAGM